LNGQGIAWEGKRRDERQTDSHLYLLALIAPHTASAILAELRNEKDHSLGKKEGRKGIGRMAAVSRRNADFTYILALDM